MVFSSILFLYYFLPFILILYYLSPKKRKNAVLFVGSLFFYAWGEPVYVALLLLSTVFNYFIGIGIDKVDDKPALQKLTLAFGVVVNLAVLIVFKYTNFLISMVNTVLPQDIPLTRITLPIGISFFTFQTISYIVDVYRKNAKAQKNYINFGTYVALFPQLIAGPIVRYNSIDEQLSKRRETIEGFTSGIICFVAGMAKKVLIANNIGMLWESVNSMPAGEISVLASWLGIIAYALQIYFDFSGYSDMAIGLGRMFGFEFEKNFDYPYISKSITEFWRRWHISLSTWFKEYVYIPLGGNRVGKVRLYLNLLIVWTLTGVWHGAGINFMAWGVYYAIILIVEKGFLHKILDKIPSIFRVIYSLFLVLIGWVFFASVDMGSAVEYLKTMFGMGNVAIIDSTFMYNITSYAVLLVVAIVAMLPYPRMLWNKYLSEKKAVSFIAVLIAVVLCTAYMVASSYNPFLYFRF
ncbi:MAG: MBOAT family protein [Clostridia bacterium]|nr:MBOAT family protein [Clostridia bacterium]